MSPQEDLFHTTELVCTTKFLVEVAVKAYLIFVKAFTVIRFFR